VFALFRVSLKFLSVRAMRTASFVAADGCPAGNVLT
jgi:hypothetical protein